MVYSNDKFAEFGENFADFQMTKPYFENGTMYRKVPKASWKNKDIRRLVLPPGTVVIEEQAFCGCMRLEAAELSNSVEEIAAGAFWGCMALRHINFPDTLQVLGKFCFWGCSSLSEITIPDNVEKIPAWGFLGCSGLVRLCLPAKLKSIDSWAFSCCSSLMVVEIPKGTQEIGEGAFSKCSALRRISIPDTVLHIGKNALPGNAEGLTVVCSRNSAAFSYAQHYGLSCECPYEDDKRVVARNKKHVRPERENADWNYPDDVAGVEQLPLPDNSEVSLEGNSEGGICDSKATALAASSVDDSYSEFSGRASGYVHESSTIGELLASKSDLSGQAPKGNPLINVMIELSDSVKSNDQYDFKVYDSYEEAKKDILNEPEIEDAGQAGSADNVAIANNADAADKAETVDNPEAADTIEAEDSAVSDDTVDAAEIAEDADKDAQVQDAGNSYKQHLTEQEALSQETAVASIKQAGETSSVQPSLSSLQNIGSPDISPQDIDAREPEDESAYLGTVLSLAAGSIGTEDSHSDARQGEVEPEETMADVWDGSMDGYDYGKSSEPPAHYRDAVMPSIFDDDIEDARRTRDGENSIFGPSCLPKSRYTLEEEHYQQNSRFYNSQAAGAAMAVRCIVPEKQLETLKDRYAQQVRDVQASTLNSPLDASPEETVLSHYLGEERNVEIPSVINGKKVIALNDALFKGNNYIEVVDIPDGVREIRKDVFRGCSALRDVHFPETLVSVGEGAFRGCERLKKVILPGGLTEIGEKAFSGCSRLEVVAIPDGVSVIPHNAFAGSALRIVVCSDDSCAAAWADANMIIHAKELSDSIGEVVAPQFAEIPVPDDIAEDDPEEASKRDKAKSKYLKRMSNAGKNKKWKKNF